MNNKRQILIINKQLAVVTMAAGVHGETTSDSASLWLGPVQEHCYQVLGHHLLTFLLFLVCYRLELNTDIKMMHTEAKWALLQLASPKVYQILSMTPGLALLSKAMSDAG